ncbi:MAG: helix-turn-helix domain-containing protein [Oceanospirillaceae bacterium]|nr:helix-turn-helix domain-containing protein [Oceanospirillaceae bacterium]
MSSKSDEVVVTEVNSSPGNRLQIAREALGISQKALADDLYLPRNYILWIEEGAYDKLPSMVFCRGYIRAYAKAVNESGDELIELLDNIYGKQNIKTPLMSVSKIDQQVKVGDPVMKWSSLIFVLVLCGLVFWWWDKQYGLESPFVSDNDVVAVETVNGDELVLESLDPDTVQASSELSTDELIKAHASNSAAVEAPLATETVNTVTNTGTGIELTLNVDDEAVNHEELAELEKVVKALEPEIVTEPVADSSANVADTLPVSVDIKLLQIQFSNECWVTIKDARGKILFNGIKKSGELLSLSGDTPLKVSIGRVNSVSNLTFGGTKIDLKALSRNNIANFQLPL